MLVARPIRPDLKVCRIDRLSLATSRLATARPRRLGESMEQFAARHVDIVKSPLCNRQLLLRVEARSLPSNSIQRLANVKDGVRGVEILVSLSKFLRQGNS